MITFMHPLQSPFRYKALSTDEKPTDATYGSMLLEEDTDIWYIFYGGVWSVASTSSFDPSSGTLTVYHDVGEGEDWGEGVKGVVIADSVKTIGAGAFASLESLEYVSIPAGVEVEDGAFSQTFKDPFDADIAMADVAGYEYVAYEGVMYQCDPSIFTYNGTSTVIAGFVGSGVKNVVLPRKKGETTLIAVGGNAFKNQTGIVRLMAVPDMGMTSYYTSAFEGCTSLTDVVLPDSMTGLGERAFYGCTSLVKVTVPDTLTTMWASVFYNCTSLRSISFTDIFSILGTGVFASCGEMTSFHFPATMTQIGAGCFASCSGVTEVSFETGFAPTLGAGCFGPWTFYAADGTTTIDKTVASNLAGKTFKGSAGRLVEDAGPQPGMEGRYMYAITTDSAGMNILSVQAAHDGRPLDTIVTASTRRQGAENIPDEWGFENGVGPFKCWYGAFNISDYVAGTEGEAPVCTGAGMLAYRLDPYDLGTTMQGTTLQGTYNVFLVVPTVYWKAVGNILYLSDDASYAGITGMTAYAHTATSDGTSSVYPYIGIGVYTASDDGTKLLSATGKSFSVNHRVDTFKAMADLLTSAGASDFQTWNYYHYTLMKMMAYTVMGTKNSQWMMGDGPVYSDTPSKSGLADSVGPYANATTLWCKLFVEDLWGNKWQMIGDISVDDHTICVGNTLGGNLLGSGGNQPNKGLVLPSTTGLMSETYVTSELWDTPKTIGTIDRDDPAVSGDNYNQKAGWAACGIGGQVTYGKNAGMCEFGVNSPLDIAGGNIGTRLSAFFDGTAMGTPEVTTKAAPAPTRSTEEDLPEAERDEPAEEPVEEEPADEPVEEEPEEPAVEEGTMDL